MDEALRVGQSHWIRPGLGLRATVPGMHTSMLGIVCRLPEPIKLITQVRLVWQEGE